MCAAALCAPSLCPAAACGIYSSARAARCGRARGYGATSRARARSAAGVTWRSRTASAQWAARFGHTSVVDAAGAIYVIGGWNGYTFFQDVWASTDGGARPDSVRGWSGGYSRGYLGG